jgi:hypothetical protein
MNHVAKRGAAFGDPAQPFERATPFDDPLATVTRAVAFSLARAHEDGRDDQVRLLHAVLALLTAAQRNN